MPGMALSPWAKMLSSTVTMTAETDGRLAREMHFLAQINQAENLELTEVVLLGATSCPGLLS
jgi:hypothetical protein